MNPLITTLATITLGLLITMLAGTLAGDIKYRILRYRANKRLREAWEGRARGTITKVGTVIRNHGNWYIYGFSIDLKGIVPVQQVDPFTGELVIGGYTREELLEIANRRAEWQNPER